MRAVVRRLVTVFRARPAVFAALAYVSIAAVLFGARVAIASNGTYVGTGVDPQIFVWSFAWWPHALLHGLNPFVTHAIWAPSGLNLAWTTSVPGLALLFAPLTLLAGPVAAFNTAAVLMPAAAAWTCFLLCRHLTGKVCPSLLGGYLFGFSSYLLGQQEGHLHMTSFFLIPLVVLVIVQFLEGSISPRQLALRTGLLLALQISFSTELLFTLTLATAVGWVVAYVAAAHLRLRLRALVAPLVAGYILSALVAAPLVYYAAVAVNTHSINQPRLYAADLLNLVIPTKLTLLSWHQTSAIAARFPGNDSERGAYLGLPVLLIIALFTRRRWNTSSGRLLLLLLLVGITAELGARLHVAGKSVLPLPSALIDTLPLFNNVLPGRISLFVSLVAAVIVALWTASSRSSVALRVGLSALAVIALFPRPNSYAWITSPANPRFITDRSYQRCLHHGENTIVLPFGAEGNSMLWQAESNFWFRLAGGYLSPVIPDAFARFRIVHRGAPATAADVLSLARAKGARAIVVDQSAGGRWRSLLPGRPAAVGGVLVYRIGPRGLITQAASFGCR